jgi:hypothetical protein
MSLGNTVELGARHPPGWYIQSPSQADYLADDALLIYARSQN